MLFKKKQLWYLELYGSVLLAGLKGGYNSGGKSKVCVVYQQDRTRRSISRAWVAPCGGNLGALFVRQ